MPKCSASSTVFGKLSPAVTEEGENSKRVKHIFNDKYLGEKYTAQKSCYHFTLVVRDFRKIRLRNFS